MAEYRTPEWYKEQINENEAQKKSWFMHYVMYQGNNS